MQPRSWSRLSRFRGWLLIAPRHVGDGPATWRVCWSTWKASRAWPTGEVHMCAVNVLTRLANMCGCACVPSMCRSERLVHSAGLLFVCALAWTVSIPERPPCVFTPCILDAVVQLAAVDKFVAAKTAQSYTAAVKWIQLAEQCGLDATWAAAVRCASAKPEPPANCPEEAGCQDINVKF